MQKDLKKFTILIIFLTVFIDMLGVGVLIPIYPLIISQNSNFSVIQINHIDPNSAYVMLGWLSACYPLMQFFFTPILGQASDIVGRRKILLISIIGTVIGYIIFALALTNKNVPLMFFARIMDGISGGSIAVGMAVIADTSKFENRAKNFGILGVAFGLGFILGPTIGGYLSDSHLSSWFMITTPFYFLSILGMLNFFLIYFLLPETLPYKQKTKIKILKSVSDLYEAYQQKELRQFLFVVFLFSFGFCLFTSFWGVTLINYFYFSQQQITNVFAYTGIWIMIGQGLIVRKLSGKISEKILLPITLFLDGACIVFIYFIPNHHANLIFITCTLLPIFHAINIVFCNSFLVSNFTNEHNRGQVIGINTSIQCLANALPAIVGGYMAETFTNTHPLLLIAGIIIIISGLIFKKIFS
jgi:DHA1 family tetracycline resistance protein-like MFS transporter